MPVARPRLWGMSLLKDFLRPFEPYVPALPAGLSWKQTLRVLQRLGFEPATVFDIGVGFGTWSLYRAFPDAHYVLIDPTPESLPYMQKIAQRLEAEVHPVALGDHDGQVMLEIGRAHV